MLNVCRKPPAIVGRKGGILESASLEPDNVGDGHQAVHEGTSWRHGHAHRESRVWSSSGKQTGDVVSRRIPKLGQGIPIRTVPVAIRIRRAWSGDNFDASGGAERCDLHGLSVCRICIQRVPYLTVSTDREPLRQACWSTVQAAEIPRQPRVGDEHRAGEAGVVDVACTRAFMHNHQAGTLRERRRGVQPWICGVLQSSSQRVADLRKIGAVSRDVRRDICPVDEVTASEPARVS